MKSLLVALAATLLVSPAMAGVLPPGGAPCDSNAVGLPDPSRSRIGLHGMDLCQYRFNAHGGLDELVVAVTLRDAFDSPVGETEVAVTLEPSAGSFLCHCCDDQIVATTAEDGTAEIAFSRLGGRGLLDVKLTTTHVVCGYVYTFEVPDVPFTTPDQNASCEAEPEHSMTVVDIGIWAAGWGGPYVRTSDFDCDGDVDVLDVGLFATGWMNGCTCE